MNASRSDIDAETKVSPTISPSFFSTNCSTNYGGRGETRREWKNRADELLYGCLDWRFESLLNFPLAARAIAVMGIIGCTVPFWLAIFFGVGCWLSDMLWSRQFLTVLLIILGCVAIFFIHLLVFSAQRKKKPRHYLPFIWINGITTALLFLFIVFLLIMYATLPHFWEKRFSVIQHETQDFRDEEVKIYTKLLLVLCSCFGAYCAFAQWVVYRAYRCMKQTHRCF